MTERLDKVLARAGFGSRSEIKRLVREGRVEVNGKIAKDSGMHVRPESDALLVDGEPADTRKWIYVMMNKPEGVVSATEDVRERTVVDLLPETVRRFRPFPVGRLDKDTEGLLLLTNDGPLAHRLLSPKKKVPKTYYVEADGRFRPDAVERFAAGIELDDGYVTLPAELTVLSAGGSGDGRPARAKLTIYEGKYHQVKRMFKSVGMTVTSLKRLSMGPLELDERLAPGQWRELTEDELRSLAEYRSPLNDGEARGIGMGGDAPGKE